MIPEIRLLSQQLVKPRFKEPKELVSWMGAVQAQDYRMVKWALGIRLKSATLTTIDEAYQRGDILRTHVMRPTWHLVPAEDIRWMLKLSSQRIIKACDSFARGNGVVIPESIFTKANNLFEKVLEGNNHLTKQELETEVVKAGILPDSPRIGYLFTRAEQEGIICSGADKDGKATYALLEERAPAAKELHKEEALALLAKRYFTSHSPASLSDFVWWSGLPVREARQAIGAIESELNKDKFASQELFIHQQWDKKFRNKDVLHFMPPFDEYLISYKDRTAVMDKEHHPKAFNNFGIFYPVILYNGRIVGNWKKVEKKGGITFDTSFFVECPDLDKELLEKAADRYRTFLGKSIKK
ncbi:winged helix DNA-binding domain-containing protein [Parabacteroides sp.]